MPKGIVRAADRVAVWHQAAENFPAVSFGDGSKSTENPTPTSTPPSGVGVPQAPAPNSNKFKTPANQLKKTLDTTSHPSMGFSPAGTQAVENWANKYPSFHQTYFKPHYQEALKGHLGEDNYAKLLHHAPTPISDPLQHYQQAPAPKSNKFTGPANQLKKLLEDPHTETSHVQMLLDKYPSFKTYLGPSYTDALKGHLGEKNYAELQTHLSPQEKAQEHQPAPLSTQPEHDYGELNIPQTLALPGDTSQHLKNWLETPGGNGQNWVKDYLQNPAKHNHWQLLPWAEQFKAHLPPEYQQYLQPQADGPYDDSYTDDDPDELAPYSHQQFLDNISHTGIGKEFQDVTTSPGFKDWWDNQDPEWQHNYIQDPAQAIDDYDEWDSGLHDEVEPADLGYGDEAYSHDEPATSQGLGDKFKAVLGPHLSAPEIFTQMWNNEPDDPESLANLKAKHPEFAPQLQQIYDEHHGQSDAEHAQAIEQEQQNFGENNPNHQLLMQFAQDNDWGPGKMEMLQSPQFKKWFAGQPQHYQDNAVLSPSQTIKDFASVEDDVPAATQQNQAPVSNALMQGINKIFPNNELDPFASHDQVKQQLESWLKYLPDHEGFAAHVPQLQALYNQHFGGGHQEPDLSTELGGLLGFMKPHFEGKPFAEQMAVLKNAIDTPGQLGTANKPAAQELYDKYKDQLGGGHQSQQEPLADWEQALMAPQEELQKKVETGGPPAHDPHAYPGASFANTDHNFWASLPGGFVDWDKHKDTGVFGPAAGLGAFLEAKGYGPQELKKLPFAAVGGKPSQVGLADEWEGLPESAKDQFAAQEQEGLPSTGGQQAPTGGGSTPYDPQGFLEGVIKADPNWWAPGKPGGSHIKKIMQDPTEAEKWLKGMVDQGTNANIPPAEHQAYKDLYDKYFGAGPQQPASPGNGPAPFDALAIAKGMQQADPGAFNDDWVQEVQHNSPEQFKKHLENLLSFTYPPEELAQYQALLDKYFGDSGQPTASHQQNLDTIANYLDKQGWDTTGAAYQKWLNTLNPAQVAWFAQDPEEAHQAFDDYSPTANQQIDYQLPQVGGPQQGAGDHGPSEHYTQPTFDWDSFGSEFKDLFPNSGWAQSAHTEDEAKEKLQNNVVKANEEFPGTEKTKAINELYEKWFGGGQSAGLDKNVTPSADWFESLGINSSVASQFAQKSPSEFWNNVVTAQQLAAKDPDLYSHDSPWAKILKAVGEAEQQAPQGGLDAFLNQVGLQQPEPESEEPAKPFKSEPVDPEDFTHWQDHKPQTPGEWKSFAQWWGNTQLAPEEESNLYHAWFPKQNKSPEQAQQWFQQVFEHNSAASNADLSQESIPNWAHNSWAFGDQAEAEWPLFKTWAAQHPGLPKNLTIKQKLGIWKGLSDDEKSQIADDYGPGNTVDAKAVVKALKAAYPDSDWSKWSKLAPSALKKSLENLGKAGYGPAAQIFNEHFGGDLPIPEEPKEGAEPQEQAEPELPPVEALPGWLQKQLEDKEPWQVQKLTKDYLQLAKFVQSVGQGHLLTDQKTNELNAVGKKWQQLPDYLKAQVAAMDTPPWSDMEGFEQWRDAQPTFKDVVAEALGKDPVSMSNNPWGYGGGYENQKAQALGKLLDQTDDPAVQQKLLEAYSQFVGPGKITLAESLKEADPDTDWDKVLQSKSKKQVMGLLKKQLKTETDPVKWTQLAHVWAKHFLHDTSAYDIAPTGIKALTDYFKSKGPGKLNDYSLAALHKYKTHNPNNELGWVGGVYGDQDAQHQQIGEQLAAADQGKNHLPYIGWTPPSGVAQGSFKMDPAQYGKAGIDKMYTAPPAEADAPNYQNLLTRADSLKHLFSDKDRALLKSDGFRNWFSKAPAAYRSSMEANPGIALDDYESFMSGGAIYPDDVLQGSGGKDKYYDLSPFALTPPQNAKGVPKSHQHMPQRADDIKFPQAQDEQETLPLPGGEKWAPKYEPLPIYRILRLDLQTRPDADRAPDSVKKKGPKAIGVWQQQQSARLRRIDEILNGGSTQRNVQKDYQYFKDWGANRGLSEKEINDLGSVLFGQNNQPDLFTDDKWRHIEDFAKFKGIDPAEMHDLASKLEVTPPPNAKGNYDHPELGQLILDYLENTAHRSGESGSSGSEGGLGWHWTRAINKMYKGVPDAGVGKNEMRGDSRFVPVAISGLWGGQGEGGGHGGAYEPHHPGEKEHSLRTHAPVHVRRVQIRAPGPENQGYGAWHDVIDHGPISLWGTGRYEEGDEAHRSDYAPGEMVKFKPSLAQELTKALNVSQPKALDDLKPGPKADAVFTDLLHKYPQKKEQLLTLYRDFFVGRPDLPTKPHTRRASIQHIPRLASLDEQNPRHLYDLATSWGVAKPERYGLPYLKELAQDLKGVGWGWKEVAKEHGLGIPNPRRGQPTVASIEAVIARMASLPSPEWMSKYFGDDYTTPEQIEELHKNNPNSWVFKQWNDENPDEENDPDYWGEPDYGDEDDGFNDDYEYDDDDFDGDPPLPTTDRPKGWPQQAPWLKNDPRGRQYFPPHGLNGPSMSGARPDIDWEEDVPEHPMLPIPRDFLPAQQPRPGEQHQLFDVADSSHEWPNDTRAVPMYRGLMLNLNPNTPGDPLGHVRRALWGGDYEPSHNPTDPTGAFGPGPFNNQNLAKPHPLGFDNPNLGEHILNHVQNNPQAYEGHAGYGLGPHWTADLPTAQSFAKGTTLGGNGESMKLPTVIRAQWKGLGEDPYRTNTQGDWPEEHEVTMLPGAKMHIDSVKIQHPHTQQWHEVLPQPTQRHAKAWSGHVGSQPRKRGSILTHSEMRR